MEETTLNVFNIERYRIHDGMGIRTAVFLKGCHLRCPWCSNPESQNVFQQMGVFQNLCISCGICAHVCENGALIQKDKEILRDDTKCTFCGKCVSFCPKNARKIYGQKMKISEIMREITKDAVYYSRSGGGVTVTGGEPLLQWKELGELIDACHQEMFPVSIESCGLIRPDIFKTAALKADELLIDVKTTDKEKVKVLFGKKVNGEQYLDYLHENLSLGVSAGRKVIMRCPIIPGFNYDEMHIRRLIHWAKELGIKRIDLLPFHQYGKNKYESLKMDYRLTEQKALHNEDLENFKRQIEREDINCVIGG